MSEDDFWGFALQSYARPGVAALCLEIQDQHGINVMLLLYACFCGACGATSGSMDPDAAVAALDPLERHLIAPLRRGRRALAGAARALGSERLGESAARVQRAEIAAERLQCLRLPMPARTVAPSAGSRLLAEHWLIRCIGSALPHARWPAEAAPRLAALVFDS